MSARQLSKRKTIQFELVSNLTQQFYVSQGNMRFEKIPLCKALLFQGRTAATVYRPLYIAYAIRAFTAFRVSNLGQDLGFIRSSDSESRKHDILI